MEMPGTLQEKTRSLASYLTDLFDDGHPASTGRSAIFGLQLLAADRDHRSYLPSSKASLRGWSRRCPTRMRLPLAEFIIFAVGDVFLDFDETDAAAALAVQYDGFFRPTEAISLQGSQVMRPAPRAGRGGTSSTRCTRGSRRRASRSSGGGWPSSAKDMDSEQSGERDGDEDRGDVSKHCGRQTLFCRVCRVQGGCRSHKHTLLPAHKGRKEIIRYGPRERGRGPPQAAWRGAVEHPSGGPSAPGRRCWRLGRKRPSPFSNSGPTPLRSDPNLEGLKV